MSTIYQAAWIFPVSQPPIRRGCLTLEAGRVTQISSSAPPSAKVHDLGDVAILPRPVNAHTHLEFSDLGQPLGRPRQSFAAWIAEVLALRGARTLPKPESIARGLAELQESLTSAVGEIATLPAAPADYFRDGDLETSSDNAHALPGVAFHELLSTSYERGLERLAEIAALAEPWPAESALKFGLSPHAPYTVEWRLLEKAVELATEKNWPLAMHLGESLDEMELLASHSGKMHQLLVDRGVWNPAGVPRGIQLTDYLSRLARAPRSLVIHGNFFSSAEHEILAAHRDRMSLVVCPRTCDYFLPTLPPIAELLRKGIHLALGTDSRATNPDLDIWNEGKFVLARTPDLEPSQILHLLTHAGAQALGLNETCGHIAMGMAGKNLAQVSLGGNIEKEEEAIAAAIEGELAAI